MRKYIPVFIGVAILILSVSFSYWFFVMRGYLSIPEVGLGNQNLTPTPEPLPYFARDERVEKELIFTEDGFVEEEIDIDAGGQVVFYTLQNNTSEELVLEFSEKPSDAPYLNLLSVDPGASVDIDFLFSGRYVLVEQNTNSSVTITTQ